MSNTEKKKEQIAKLLAGGEYIDEVEHEVRLEEAEEIIAISGVWIEAEDQSLPKNKYTTLALYCFEQIRRNEGFMKVEPKI